MSTKKRLFAGSAFAPIQPDFPGASKIGAFSTTQLARAVLRRG